MTSWEAVALGLVQGLTEFIPVSSSAHLALAHWAFGWQFGENQDLVFDVATHAGTLGALLVFFWKDWVGLLTRRSQRPLLYLVLAACAPGALAGALLNQQIESLRQIPWLIAVLLATMGLVMGYADRRGVKRRRLEDLNWGDALWVGCSQALALLPGVSRSGITITAGLATGMTRETAARYSFLLSAPIIAGAALWESRHLAHGLPSGTALPLLLGILSAGVSGYLAIGFLLDYLRTKDLKPFVIYRIALAIVVIGVWLVRG